jgi:DNA-binding NarL/FixJ family response regulator
MSGDEPITIVLADDHAVVRTGLRLVLEAHDDLRVVAEAGTVPEAVAMTKAHRPSVLVLDLAMPGAPALDVIPELARGAAPTKVVILTMEDEPEFARRALSAGAVGYVLKEAAHSELVEAVRRAAAGGSYLDPSLGARLAAAVAPPEAGAPDGLTARELEILRLVALGHTNAEVGQILHLSVRTVEARRAHVQQKTGRTGRPELVRYALERGLLADPPPASSSG